LQDTSFRLFEAVAVPSATVTPTQISTSAVEVAGFIVTEYSPLGQSFYNITYFAGM